MASSENGAMEKFKQPLKARSRAKTSTTTTMTTTTTTSRTVTDEEKCKMIQQQLLLFIHAFNCQSKENGPDGHKYKNCYVPLCKIVKEKLNHMSQCQDGDKCVVSDCWMSRQILDHWKDCTNKSECMVCSPLSSDSKKSSVSVHPKTIDWKTMEAKKEWKNPFNRQIRESYVTLFVQGVLASVDKTTVTEETLKGLNEFCKTIETAVYTKVVSNEEYYHYLAEKVFEVQRCIGEKTLKKNKQTKPLSEILQKLQSIQ